MINVRLGFLAIYVCLSKVRSYVAIFPSFTVKTLTQNTQRFSHGIILYNKRKSLFFGYTKNRVVIECFWLQGIGKRVWCPGDLQQDSRTDGRSTEDLRRCA